MLLSLYPPFFPFPFLQITLSSFVFFQAKARPKAFCCSGICNSWVQQWCHCCWRVRQQHFIWKAVLPIGCRGWSGLFLSLYVPFGCLILAFLLNALVGQCVIGVSDLGSSWVLLFYGFPQVGYVQMSLLKLNLVGFCCFVILLLKWDVLKMR